MRPRIECPLCAVCRHLTVSIGHSGQPIRLSGCNVQNTGFAKFFVMVDFERLPRPKPSFNLEGDAPA